MIEQHVLQYLKDNLYIIAKDNGHIISNKLLRELGGNAPSITPVPVVKQLIAVPKKADKDTYKLFIEAAEVPSKITTANGSYWANRYSESGYKAFAKVFNDDKISRPILLASTKWYYKQANTARKMIGNYFSEGIWESNYDDFVREIKNRDTKTTIIGNPAPDGYPPQGIWIPKIVDENESNMEAG